MMKLIEFKEEHYKGLLEHVQKMRKCLKTIEECLEEGSYDYKKHRDYDDDDDEVKYRRGGRYSMY